MTTVEIKASNLQLRRLVFHYPAHRKNVAVSNAEYLHFEVAVLSGTRVLFRNARDAEMKGEACRNILPLSPHLSLFHVVNMPEIQVPRISLVLPVQI
jgi:hypothetical protein